MREIYFYGSSNAGRGNGHGQWWVWPACVEVAAAAGVPAGAHLTHSIAHLLLMYF